MSDDLLSALRAEYAELPVPDYPASAVAAARLARGPRRRSPVLRFALAGAGGMLAGALFVLVAHHQPVQTAALPASETAPRTVSLDEARRLATFPVVVPQGVPVDSVRIGGNNSTVQMIVSPRSGDRVLMVERPADATEGRGATSWRSGTTSVTVLDPLDGEMLRRLRQATGAP
jgi:hypothetical protein